MAEETDSQTEVLKIKEEPEEVNSSRDKSQSSESQVKKEVKKKEIFQCADCGLKEEYDYYGKKPPFCRSIEFKESSYICRDPFSSQVGNSCNFLLLGSQCSLCQRSTCQACSVFYTRRLCAQCSNQVSTLLPQQVIKNNKSN